MHYVRNKGCKNKGHITNKYPGLQEDMMKEKLMELFKDEEFYNQLTECESAEGALALLSEHGLEFTKEELKEIFDTLSTPPKVS